MENTPFFTKLKNILNCQLIDCKDPGPTEPSDSAPLKTKIRNRGEIKWEF